MKRVLSIQDISCIGKCSQTVALPVISAMGIETAILPTAVLSAHTAFDGFTFKDLTDEMPEIIRHWDSMNIKFDAIYTGYLGSEKQVEIVEEIFSKHKESLIIVDPVMGDNGKLYAGFEAGFAECMRKLCRNADVILPNITEASYLTGEEYIENGGREYICRLAEKLLALGTKNAVITGVTENGRVGAFLYDGKESFEYLTDKVNKSFHGTGDVFAAAFCGAVLSGKDFKEAVKCAADFTLESIKCTDDNNWYSVNFEKALPKLIESIR